MRKREIELEYPEAVKQRHGCKVGWLYYKDKRTAKLAAKAAKHNALIQAAKGFDFGYQCPGSIQVCEWDEYKGLYEVCIP